MPRNAAGAYTLPTGNPVVTGTLITSTWANATMPDIGAELTNSLDRNGRGSMLAALKATDGLLATPGITFSNEPTTGLFRNGAGDLRVSVLGVMIAAFSSGVVNVNGNVISGVANITSTSNASAYTIWGGGPAGIDGGYIQLYGSTNGTPNQLLFGTAGTTKLQINATLTQFANNKVKSTTSGNTGGDVASSYSLWSSDRLCWIDSARSADNKQAEVAFGGGTFQARFVNDAYTLASNIIVASGGQAAGVAALDFYNGVNAVAMRLANGFLNISPAFAAATYQLQVQGSGQGVANMTDAGAKSSSIFLRDTSNAGAGQGGAVLFSAFDSATPMCGIKGYITDAASNTRGDIVFITRRVATDAFLTETMRVTATGIITDKDSNELGYKGLPSASVTTGAFVASDRGKMVLASGGVTIPNSVMAANDVVTIHNNTAGAITLTASVASLKLCGTASTGNRTLAAAGICTVVFLTPTIAVISGAGLS